MSQTKPPTLSQILGNFAPEGSNDARWFLFEHQLEQAKISLHAVVGTLKVIAQRPENHGEGEIAEDCLSYMEAALCDLLGARASILSYLSGTDVPERISRTEV